jgi:gamma-glutamyltranspeptidase/glutathione hydrolase
MKKKSILLVIIFYLLLLPWGCSKKPAPGSLEADLSPTGWPEGELEKYSQLNLVTGVPKPPVEADNGMVVGACGPLAIRAGVEALKKGGNAMDAALTTSLTQVTLLAGSNVSFAGVMFLVYYDAKNGKVHSMHASWNTVKNESDPMSIPFPGTPSGRQVLVPGFMAGVQSAHQRFGKLSFAALFEPAVYFAEKGFIVDKALEVRIKSREQEIARFPATKDIFTKENGELYKAGDLLKQPRVAETLRRVAREGADYMYRGEWAKKFVRAVRQQGGKMTLKDLEDYKVTWSEPAHTTYRGYDIYSMGAPGFAGVSMIGAFNLLELADLEKSSHYTRSAKALYQFIRISRVCGLYYNLAMGRKGLGKIFSKYISMKDFSRQSLMSKKTAKMIWKKMQGSSWKDFQQEVYLALKKGSPGDEEFIKDIERTIKKKNEAREASGHSDCVVAIDKEGNMAAVVHSINSQYFGFGLTVDGVSVADTGSYMKEIIALVGPGKRLIDSTNQVIVLKKGKPFLATSCIGGGLYEATLQCVVNVLDYNMDPQTAVETPYFMTPALHPDENNKQTVGEGQFPDEILEALRAMGQEIKVLSSEEQWLQTGGWVGIKIDPKTGKCKGGVPLWLNGVAAGY